MNNKQQKLMTACAVVNPLEGRILVAADKVRTYKDKTFTSSPVDPEVKEEDITPETEMVMEEVIGNVNYRYQTALVLQVPEDETRFNTGDTILFDIGALQGFDYIKGAITPEAKDNTSVAAQPQEVIVKNDNTELLEAIKRMQSSLDDVATILQSGIKTKPQTGFGY